MATNRALSTLLFLMALVASIDPAAMATTIKLEREVEGIRQYRLTNERGANVLVSSLGAGIVEINVPDRDGILADVVIGYADPRHYLADGPCAGKVPGRYANRIAAGKLTVNGVTHQLAINNGPNHLHGGPTGFQNHNWDSAIEDDKVVFTLVSPDGDENYPGELKVRVAYSWDDECRLDINLDADTDAPTAVNLTNHTYFNLAGENSGTVLNQRLKLYCSRWLPTDDTLIPTGEIASVEGTPMDFIVAKPIGQDIKADFPALRYGKGYDNCWLIDGWEEGKLCPAAQLIDDESGRCLLISTTQPAAQVYTGNWLEGAPRSVSGGEYHDYDAVAIECQGCPDAPNHTNFPRQTLFPDEHYHRLIRFAFSTK